MTRNIADADRLNGGPIGVCVIDTVSNPIGGRDHCLEWARTAGRRLRAIRRFFEACVWCGAAWPHTLASTAPAIYASGKRAPVGAI